MKCRRCNVEMQAGKALLNVATAGAPDFIGSRDAVTYSFGQVARLVDVAKCPKCGFSRSEDMRAGTGGITPDLLHISTFGIVEGALNYSRQTPIYRTMESSEKSFEVTFENVKEAPTYAMTGAWGGPTPDNSAVVTHIYVEHWPIPFQLQYEREGDVVNLKKESRVTRSDLTRKVQATLVMPPEVALQFAHFLRQKATAALQNRNQPPSSED